MPSDPPRSVRRATLAGALLLLASGCLGYRLGSMLPADIRSVYVPAFANATREPQIEIEATNAAIREFQKDGTLRVAAAEAADILLEATLTGYELAPLRYDSGQPTRATEYRIALKAKIAAKRRDTGANVLREQEVVGESWFVVTTDLTSARQEALPAAAAQLAHNIVERIVEAW